MRPNVKIRWNVCGVAILAGWLLGPLVSGGTPAGPSERALPYGRDDFCARTNQAWMASNHIPATMPYNSEYVESTQLLTTQIRSIIDEALQAKSPSVVQQSILGLYESYTNLADREKRQLSSLAADLHAIETARTHSDEARLFARTGRYDRDLVDGSRYPAPVPFFIQEAWLDPKDPRHVVPYLAPSGLGLPDTSYYSAEDPRFLQIRKQYAEHVSSILRLAGSTDSGSEGQRVLVVETALAKLQAAAIQDSSPDSGLFTAAALTRIAPAFDWVTFLSEAGLSKRQAVYVRLPKYIANVVSLWASLNTADRVLYLRWQLLRHYSPYLNGEYSRAATDFYSKILNGTQDTPQPEQAAAALIPYLLPDEVSAEYVRKFASPVARSKAQAIAETVKLAFRDRVQAANWLGQKTRAEALKKLDAMSLQIAYPDTGTIPRTIPLRRDDLVGNLKLLSARSYEKELRRLHRWRPQDEWLASAASIDAAYSQATNTLVVAAGRLQPPLFDPSGDDASNYGGLGTLIGHEMGHALDTIGSQYDASGQIRHWWSKTDRQEFHHRANLLAAQFDTYEPLPGMQVSGDRTIAEDIADLTGLTLGFEALQKSRHIQERALSHDDERRFFEGWARRWRVEYTEPLLAQIMQRDTHAPLQYRCIVPLSDFTPFYAFGGIRPGDPDYRTPDERVTIW
jgi:putative endopeptidase